MKALLKVLFSYLPWQKRRKQEPLVATDTGAERLDFATLSQHQQDAAKQYFAAATNLMLTVNCIRDRRRAVDVDSVLAEFRLAERGFIMADLRPVFPPSVQCLGSFDPVRLISKGLLARLKPSEDPVIYASAMDRHVTKLMAKFKVCELDSTRSFNPLT
jgi:hypothetical protein